MNNFVALIATSLHVILHAMSESKNDIEGVLKSIASQATRQSIESSYNNVGAVMKEIGGPTNNMLLSAIHAETKRHADELLKINTRVSRLESLMSGIYDNTDKMCELMEQQNILLSSQHLQLIDGSSTPTGPSTSSRQPRQLTESSGYFYNGFKLTSKTKIITCIISQLMDIVRLRMENSNIRYPDSVDCKFTTLDACISESSKQRCLISGIEFKGEIPIPDMGTPAFEAILPLIASVRMNNPTTLPESRLIELTTPLMRDLMLAIERILQRLSKLDHILSPQQIDILKSIKIPIIIPGSEGELNWNSSAIQPRKSNPLCDQIANMSPTGKKIYVHEMMRSQTAMQSWRSAYERTRKQ